MLGLRVGKGGVYQLIPEYCSIQRAYLPQSHGQREGLQVLGQLRSQRRNAVILVSQWPLVKDYLCWSLRWWTKINSEQQKVEQRSLTWKP